MLQAMKRSFPQTIPILAGYVSLGAAFGLLVQSAGYGPLWAFAMGTVIYAGSAQFLCVELLAVGATLPQVALLTLLLNFRHFFYGLSMIPCYREAGKRRWYLIFGLSDEVYALLTSTKVPEGVTQVDYCFAVTLMSQCYWVTGCVLGATAGSLIAFDTTGIDFAMTALFAVMVVEQWKAHSRHLPALLGFGVTIASLMLLGPDNFLVSALIVLSGLLLALRSRLEAPAKEGTPP